MALTAHSRSRRRRRSSIINVALRPGRRRRNRRVDVQPDLLGYSKTSKPTDLAAYNYAGYSDDLVEILDAEHVEKVISVGHDWGSPVVWSLAAHHKDQVVGAANLCVPYIARGFALPNLIPLVDRSLYPEDRFPAGQWDYQIFYEEQFERAYNGMARSVSSCLL